MQVRAQQPLSGQASCSGSSLHAAGPKRLAFAVPKTHPQHLRIQRQSQLVRAEEDRGEGRSGSLCYGDDDGMAKHLSHSLNRCCYLVFIDALHAGPLEAVVDKVKDVLGIDESVDENILEYCSLDKAVSARI